MDFSLGEQRFQLFNLFLRPCYPLAGCCLFSLAQWTQRTPMRTTFCLHSFHVLFSMCFPLRYLFFTLFLMFSLFFHFMFSLFLTFSFLPFFLTLIVLVLFDVLFCFLSCATFPLQFSL